MNIQDEADLKNEIIRQHFKHGRTVKSLAEEHGLTASRINGWIREYLKECRQDKELRKEYNLMKEYRRLTQKKEELEAALEIMLRAREIADEGDEE